MKTSAFLSRVFLHYITYIEIKSKIYLNIRRLEMKTSVFMKFAEAHLAAFIITMGALQAQEVVFFSENFEGLTHAFTVVNGTQTNQWRLGTATAFEGTRSMYISNDAGVSNRYSNTSSVVHLYTDITFPMSDEPFLLRFRWRCEGESSFDDLSVRLISTSTIPSAGNTLSASGVTFVRGGATTWNLATVTIPASNSGTTGRLVFSWRNDASVNNPPPAAIDDISITAVMPWSGPIVNFNLNGGSGTLPAVIRVEAGATISAAQRPSTTNFTRTGFVNDGKWYTRTGIVDHIYTEFIFGENGTPVTESVTLFLQWIPAYTVSFNLNGGSGTVPTSVNVAQGGTLSAAQRPSTANFTRTGFVNDGKWYTRTGIVDHIYTEFIFGENGTAVTENTTLFLQWTPAYTVSFNLNGGTGTTPASINVIQGGTISEAQRPSTANFTRAGFVNDGKWYIRAGITEPFTFTEFIFGDGGTPVTSATTLWLRWSVDTERYDSDIAGAGTVANPYVIVNPRQLAYVALMVNEGNSSFNTAYYRLDSHLDLSNYGENFNGGRGWVPIGRTSTNAFRGGFNGNGRRISGLYINDPTLDYAGLFGFVGGGCVAAVPDAYVLGIGVEGANVTGRDFVGAIAGYVAGGGMTCALETLGGVSNSYVTGTVSGRSNVGGITGYVNSWGYASESYSTAAVSGTNNVGGIAGYVQGEVHNTLALNLSVTGTGGNVGRVVGAASGGWVGELVGNFAFVGVLNNSGTTAWANKGLTRRDGEDITIADINVSPTLNGSFTEARGFSIAPGSLPGFGRPVQMPPHLGGPVKVAEADRIIPPTGEETAVVAPVVVTAGEFTAGPNPVDRQSGNVAFYWSGRSLSGGTLFVYDASGNVVNRIAITGNASNGQARRQIGTWNLTDRRDRPVSESAYLVRGVLIGVDGKRERVSAMVGVR